MDFQDDIKRKFLKVLGGKDSFDLTMDVEQRSRYPYLLGLEGPEGDVINSVAHLRQARAGNYSVSLTIEHEYEMGDSGELMRFGLRVYVYATGTFERTRKQGKNRGLTVIRQHNLERTYEFEGNSINLDSVISEITCDINRDIIGSGLTKDMVESMAYTEILDPTYLTSPN